MPIWTFIVNRLSLIRKNLLFTLYSLLFTIFLTGCSAIGYSKPAALQVTSNPEAAVFLDGKHLGKTPFYSDQLKGGDYTVKVTVSDATYVDKITLTEGTLTVVNRDLSVNFLASAGENLSLVPQKSGFFAISYPTDADITIDGRYFGKTPILVNDLEDGDHKVLISKTGYVNREFAIKSSSKYQLLADITLASQIAKGNGQKTDQKTQGVKEVTILPSPQGFLRVRREPKELSEEIGKVNSSETVEIIQQTDDWLQIKLEGKLGWIQKKFTKEVL